MPSLVLLCSALIVAALDQASKVWVLAALRAGRVASFGVVVVRLVMNPYGAGGPGLHRHFVVGLWVVAVTLLVTLVEFVPRYQSPLIQVALGAALGGATGNVIDRVWRGRVVDFIDLRFWPVFNLADAAIVAGALVAVLRAL